MMKSIRRRRSRKSKAVDTPALVEDDSSSRGNASQIENMGALETPSREHNAAFEDNHKTSKINKGTPATDITDLVESDEDNEIYEVSSVSSGELMQRRRSGAKTVKKPVFIQDELEALRTRQLARNLRKDLQDAEKKTNVAVPFAAVDTESFYSKQREQNKAWKKKQEDSRNYLNSYRGAADATADTPPRKSTKKYGRAANPSAASSEMDQFYSKQKAMNNDWKQKQRDANALLHQYRGYSDDKEQLANVSFEELLSLQMQAAGFPLPDSPIAHPEPLFDDNSDAIIATSSLPYLDDPAPTEADSELSSSAPTNTDSGEGEDANKQERDSIAHQPSSGVAGILDEMGEILVEMEEMSHVDLDITKGESEFVTPIASQLSHESGASLGLPEDEVQNNECVPNAPTALEEDEVSEVLETSIIVDLDEPLAEQDGVCEKVEALESPVIPGSDEHIVKSDDDEADELSDFTGPGAIQVDTVPTTEEDVATKDALEEPSAIVDLDEPLSEQYGVCENVDASESPVVPDSDEHIVKSDDDEADELSDFPGPGAIQVDTVPTTEEDVAAKEDPEEPFAVDLVETPPMEDCGEDRDEQELVVDLHYQADHVDATFEAPDELDDILDDMLDDILDVNDEALLDDCQLETVIDAAVVEEPPAVTAIGDSPAGDAEIMRQDSPQTDKRDTQPAAIGVADSSRKVAKQQTKRPVHTPRQSVPSPKTPARISRIVTPRTSRRSDDDSTACSTLSSRRRARYDPNSPSRLTESTVASRSARRERHQSSDLNSYSPRKTSVPIYSRRSSKVPQCCTGKLILDLHVNRAGCERCLHFASPSEKRKYDEEGHHYRINIIRGGCSRKCKLFPRTEKEPPVRLCRQCFYDTHTHGKV